MRLTLENLCQDILFFSKEKISSGHHIVGKETLSRAREWALV